MFPFLIALCVPIVALPLLTRCAGRWGLIDMPGARSTHSVPVPRLGGLGLGLGILAGMGGLLAFGRESLDAAAMWGPYLIPAALYFVIGLADDLRSLSPRFKFALQALAAAVAVGLGLRWGGDGLGPFGPLSFGAATVFFSWLWLIAVVILVNFLDGLDLITVGGAVVLLGAGAGAGAGPGGGAFYGVCCAAVIGLGFWNASPARVFPGDAATHLLGFLIGSLALHVPGAPGSATAALPWVAASAPLLPGVIDVGLGLVVKARFGVPLSQAHNQHLSQRLTRRGSTHAGIALRYGLLALLGLWLVAWLAPNAGLAVCLIVAAVVLSWHLGSGLQRTWDLPYRFE